MSIHPTHQKLLLQPDLPRNPKAIDIPIAKEVITTLETIPEFVRAYDPDGMKPEEFLAFGVCQKTLSQFYHGGWALLDTL